MATATAVSTHFGAGTTLVRSGETKAQRLANALRTGTAANVYETQVARSAKTPQCRPKNDKWSYVGTELYNKLLENALKHTGARKAARHTPAGITRDTEQFLRVLDIVSDAFLEEGAGGRRKNSAARRSRFSKHGESNRVERALYTELIKLLVGTDSDVKRSLRRQIVAEEGAPSPPCSAAEARDVPLMRWELDTCGNGASRLVRTTLPLERAGDCKLCGMIDRQKRDGMPIKEGGDYVIKTLTEKERSFSGQSQMSKTWVWVDSVDHSQSTETSDIEAFDDNGAKSAITDIKAAGAATDMPKAAVCRRPTDETNDTVSSERAKDPTPMAETVAVAPPEVTALDDRTLPAEVNPAQLAKAAAEDTADQKHNDQKIKKTSKKRSSKSTLKSLDLDKFSGFYVVNASADWAFD